MGKTGRTKGIFQKMTGNKGMISVILAGSLLFTACGAKEEKQDTTEYLYVPEPVQEDILSGSFMNVCNFHVTENALYLLDQSLYRIPIENGLNFEAREEVASCKELFQAQAERTSLEDISTRNSILCFTLDEQENLYYCTTSYEEMCIVLNKRSSDGEPLYQIPMEPEKNMSGFSNDPFLAVDDEGNAYLLTKNTLQRYDGEGNLTGQLALDDDLDDNFLIRKSLMEGPGGEIFLFINNSLDVSRKAYRILEGSSPRLEHLESLSETPCFSSVYEGRNGPLVMKNDGWLYQYRIEEQTMDALLLWEDSNIYKNDLYAVVEVTEDLLLLLIKDDSDPASGMAQSLTLLVRTPADEVPQKERITLASLFPNDDLREAVVKFNQSSTRYHVSIESYGAKSVFDDNEGAFTRLDSSLTAKDSTPDLLDFTDLDFWKYADAEAMEDLNSYIETSEGIRKSDYLSNLLEGYTVNGKLICIPKAFYFMGAWVTDERALEADTWSIESLMALADKYEDVKLFPGNWDKPDVMLRLFFSDYILNTFIDRESGKCLLDSDQFCSLLEWVKEQTRQAEESQNSLLDPKFINGFEKYHHTLVDSGGQITLRGLPSTEGKTACNVSVENAVGILANSSHKEGAWAFLEFFLQREREITYSDYTYRFPTKITILDQITEDITTPNYVEIDGKIINGADGNPLVDPESAYYSEGVYHEYYAMEKSDADILRQLLEQIDFTPQSSLEQSVISIITEEAAPFFDGVKSAEEAADIIQNRVQVLLSEHQ